MKLAALCCTFRRPHMLGQLIESFLRQDYPRDLRGKRPVIDVLQRG